MQILKKKKCVIFKEICAPPKVEKKSINTKMWSPVTVKVVKSTSQDDAEGN